jgi:CheY-like chemotaxis protein
LLVVDDEPIVRMLITDVLRDLGYTAIDAEDGATGLKVLESEGRIDLMIADVGLPGGTNGRQLADAARLVRPALKGTFHYRLTRRMPCSATVAWNLACTC